MFECEKCVGVVYMSPFYDCRKIAILSHSHRIAMKRSSINTKLSTEHAPARPSATPEGASKNPLTSQTGAEQFAEDGAPTARIAQPEDVGGAGPQSLAAGQAHQSNAAGQAQKEEPRVKVGTPWQIMLALGALICPVLVVGGALMATSAISWSGVAFVPLSFSCFALLLLCDPSNRDGEKYLIPLYVLSFVSSVGTVMYVNLVQLKFSTFASITVPLTLLLCLFGMLFFFILARRKIGDFTRQDLKDFVYKGVFWNGLGSLTPIIYLTAENLKCLLEHNGEIGLVVRDSCDGVYFPQLSICFMFVRFLDAPSGVAEGRAGVCSVNCLLLKLERFMAFRFERFWMG